MSSPNVGEGRTPTRTIAILAKTACSTHRQAIQTQIVSNAFIIVDERLEQWSKEDDDEFLNEFLRDPSAEDSPENQDVAERSARHHQVRWRERLTDGPIYVMVLERQRATETLLNLFGPDLDEGDQDSIGEDGLPIVKTGLRAKYGNESLYAPWSATLAERQVAICFPELATSEALAQLQVNSQTPHSTVMAINSNGGFLVREDDDIVYDDEGQAFDAHSGEPLELQQEVLTAKDSNTPSKSGLGEGTAPRTFKARPMPTSYKQTANQPRLSRAAALRMGVALPSPPKRAASVVSSETKDSNKGISGLPKANVSMPKSLAAPTIAPRMNKNASARTGKGAFSPSTSESGSTLAKERKPVDYSNTPGHKRISTGGAKLASLAAPSVAPRLNKTAAARVAAGATGNKPTVGASPSSTPSHRSTRSMSVTSSSVTASTGKPSTSSPDAKERKPVDFSNTPGHKRASMSVSSSSTLKSLQAPSIAPRANRASLARGGSAGIGSAEVVERPSVSSTAQSRSSSTVASRQSAVKTSDRPASVARERRPVDYSNTPGHKRASSAMGGKIASLAAPSIAPRSNTASQHRLSAGGVITSSPSNAGRLNLRTAAPPSSFRV